MTAPSHRERAGGEGNKKKNRFTSANRFFFFTFCQLNNNNYFQKLICVTPSVDGLVLRNLRSMVLNPLASFQFESNLALYICCRRSYNRFEIAGLGNPGMLVGIKETKC